MEVVMWDSVFEWLSQPAAIAALRIVGVVFAAFILTRVLKRGVRKVEGKVSEHTTPIRALQRTQTLAKVLSSAGIILIWAFAGIYIIASLGFDLAPLLAGVSIIGLAVGFGAQNLVRDVVTGFFILFEDQYGVGDVIMINEVATGKVEQLTLRLTGLRDLDGTMHYVSNGTITHVANRTKDWSRAVIDVRVSYNADQDHTRRVLEEIAHEAKNDETIGRALYSVPEVLGVEQLGDYDVVWRLLAETKPGRQWDIARQIRERIKVRLDEEGIEIPLTPPVVVSSEAGSNRPSG
jgi:moderate conductance mechanosensitive channel